MNSSDASSIVDQLVAVSSTVSEIPREEAIRLLDRVATIHGVDEQSRYWWQSACATERIDYGQSIEKWKEELIRILDSMGEGAVYLAVTDDESFPWPVLLISSPTSLVDILAEVSYFEYFIFSMDCSSLMFDTSHNMLLVSNS